MPEPHPATKINEVKLILQVICPQSPSTIRSLIENILAKIGRHERLSFHFWTDDKWYVEVQDLNMMKTAERFDERTASTRLGFTVNFLKDEIVFNYEGGNCWVRGRRWRNFIFKHYDFAFADNEQIDLDSGRRCLEHKHIHVYSG